MITRVLISLGAATLFILVIFIIAKRAAKRIEK